MFKERQRRPCQRPRQSRLHQCCLRSCCCCSVVYGLFTNRRGRLSRTNLRTWYGISKMEFFTFPSSIQPTVLSINLFKLFLLSLPPYSFISEYYFSILIFYHADRFLAQKLVSYNNTGSMCSAWTRCVKDITGGDGAPTGSHRHLFPPHLSDSSNSGY